MLSTAVTGRRKSSAALQTDMVTSHSWLIQSMYPRLQKHSTTPDPMSRQATAKQTEISVIKMFNTNAHFNRALNCNNNCN